MDDRVMSGQIGVAEEKTPECPRLLVVDDNDNIHEDMRYILGETTNEWEDATLLALKGELFGAVRAQPRSPISCYHIDDAWQGEEAIRMVREAVARQEPYSIVFLDLHMPPGMDGITVAGRIWEEDPHVEIVICTAYSDYAWEQVASLYGHSDHLLFVRKPFDSVSLKQIALSLSTKWRLARDRRAHMEQLETEVRRRTAELEETVARLQHEVALRQDKEHQLARQAHYDTLTGLLNRYAFYVMVGKMAAAPPPDMASGPALLFVDIDGFKAVNDRYGHDTGDLLLSEIAMRLRLSAGTQTVLMEAVVALSAGEEPEQGIFRLGGDEFTVLLPFDSREDVQRVAQHILDALHKPFLLRGREVRVTGSIGVSVLQEDASDFGTLLKHADTAMYKAKESRGAVVFYDELRGTGWLDPAVLSLELETALETDQFENYYQHVFGPDGRLAGMSAFPRWNHERFGVVMPEFFLPVAESLGLTDRLERGVLAHAARQVASISIREHRALFVLVHCAVATLTAEDFPAFLTELRKSAGLGETRLRLAVPLSFVTGKPEVAARTLESISACGVGLVIEGVSDGQSMQALARVLPAGSIIQPDSRLLRHIVSREGDRLFLNNLMTRARAFGMEMLVAGIETDAQAEVIASHSLYRQGFLYGGPVPFDVFVREMNRVQGGGTHDDT